MFFASHEYGKSYVFDKGISLDRKRLVIIGKDIDRKASQWILYILSFENGDYAHRFRLGYLNYKEVLAAYNDEIEKAEEAY